jgi:hypothetical protein
MPPAASAVNGNIAAINVEPAFSAIDLGQSASIVMA